jgi:hypothetical protein
MVLLKNKDVILPHKYLVEVEGLRKVFVDGVVSQFLEPSEIYNRTKGLVTEGIVRGLPLSHHKAKALSRKVRFLYTEADATIEGKYPQIEGHLQVYHNNLTAFEGDKGWETVGDFISMSPIPRNRTEAGLLLPGIKRISHDTAKGEELEFDEFYNDKAIVNLPNEHFPVGTYVFFTKPDFVHKTWPEGYLIRRRNILAWGKDVKKMTWLKPIKIKR